MLGGIIFGAIAGTAGVWVMDRVGWFMYRREDPEALQQEKEARADGLDTAHAAANKVSKLGGKKLSSQPHPAGLAIHYGLGVVPAILLAILIDDFPWLGLGYGLLYGFILFVVNDEILAPLLRFASRPNIYPWQAHVRGLVTHLVLGVVTVTLFQVMRRSLL